VKPGAEKRHAKEWIRIVHRYMLLCFRTGSVPRVKELAGMLSISREEFTRAFHAATGRSPASTFRAFQLRWVMDLLANSDQPTAEIAVAAAYGSARAFYRAFRRSAGMTPTEYRNRFRLRREPPAHKVPNTTKHTG
jgi:transcriptional regulator GlxA family with amidase domain